MRQEPETKLILFCTTGGSHTLSHPNLLPTSLGWAKITASLQGLVLNHRTCQRYRSFYLTLEKANLISLFSKCQTILSRMRCIHLPLWQDICGAKTPVRSLQLPSRDASSSCRSLSGISPSLQNCQSSASDGALSNTVDQRRWSHKYS